MNSPQPPLLSVIMPVHAGAEWIAATLDSVAAGPSEGLEIIVLDSSPDDSTTTIVERYADLLPLKLLRRPDLAPWQTKTNLGVELASADHVCMLHQDDLWLPGRMMAVRRWIANRPDATVHLAPTLVVDGKGRKVGLWTCPLPAGDLLETSFVLERLMVQNFVSVPAPIFRKSAWLDCGGMDETLWYTADWDMWLKLVGAGTVAYHDEVTTAFRVHGGSLTVTGSRNLADFRSQMEVVLDRHLTRLPPERRRLIEDAARASVSVNVSLAAVSGGSGKALIEAIAKLLSLGPVAIMRYLRDSRLRQRVVCRLRAKAAGAF